jgi:tetratricopeptide (TPR) repeat protein
MIDLKAFYQSYTRAAHLRWLRGDSAGAIEMMNAAVKAASLRDRESVAWAYTRLADYELQRGHLDEAERMADASLQYVPDYAAALLARGRIRARAEQRHRRCGRTLARAARLNPLPEYQWTLADAAPAGQQDRRSCGLEQQLVRDGAGRRPAHAGALPLDPPRGWCNGRRTGQA